MGSANYNEVLSYALIGSVYNDNHFEKFLSKIEELKELDFNNFVLEPTLVHYTERDFNGTITRSMENMWVEKFFNELQGLSPGIVWDKRKFQKDRLDKLLDVFNKKNQQFNKDPW